MSTEGSILRRRLNITRRKIDEAFSAHIKTNGRNGSAENSCSICNRYWGALAAIDVAIELTKNTTAEIGRIAD